MNFIRSTPILLVVFVLLVLSSCQKDDILEVSSPASDYASDVPLKWFELFTEIDRYAPGYRPPASARAMGYIGLAGYEAAVPGMEDYQSLGGHYSELQLPITEHEKVYHWPTATNAAYYSMIQHFYPHLQASQLQKINELNQSFEIEFSAHISAEIYNRSKAFGQDVADAIFEWSASDEAGHGAYLNPRPSEYIPPSGPGLWQPTAPDFTPALFPYWGQVRTFAMRQNDLLARPPLRWSEDPSSQFYVQAKEVQVWVDDIRSGNDEEAHWIAEFWSDDFAGVTFTPAGRWVAVANQIVEQSKPSLETSVRLYAQMGMALCDAGVAVWHSKFTYNIERPISYIHRNFDPNWQTIMNHPLSGIKSLNPEFPAYPSGHSGFGGAGATILTEIFGYPSNFTDRCHQGRTEFKGMPRSFGSFIDMAVENAYSRIPLGVHFRMDCDEGLRQGYLAGQRVLELPWRG